MERTGIRMTFDRSSRDRVLIGWSRGTIPRSRTLGPKISGQMLGPC
jgi:hypothetical protein